MVDLLVVVVVIGVLAAMFLPGWMRKKAMNERISCVGGQKNIGTSFRVFASDNGDMYPLQAKTNSYIVPSGATGTQVNSATAESWQIAQCMWNELQTPKILLCPCDRERATSARVSDFNGLAKAPGPITTTSLAHPANQNRAVSYAFGVAADESRPLGVLVVDRNVNNVGVAGASAPGNVALTLRREMMDARPGPTQAVWVRGTRIHNLEGNLTFADGSVQQATVEVLRRSFENALTSYGSAVTNQNEMIFP